MKILLRFLLVFVMFFGALPAFGEESMQIWRCEMDDDASEEQVIAMAQEWLAEAKKMPGGENLKAFVNFPVAVNTPGEIDILFVVVAPSFQEWGEFWDSYLGSPAEEVDKKYEDKVACPGSALWEVKRVK